MLIKRPRLRHWRKDRLLVWRLINWIVLGMLLAAILLSYYFIYVYIFQTLDSANAIAILNANTNYDVVNLTDFKIVEERIAIKKAIAEPDNGLRNIFVYEDFSAVAEPVATDNQVKPEH